jgi:hypothetical protein
MRRYRTRADGPLGAADGAGGRYMLARVKVRTPCAECTRSEELNPPFTFADLRDDGLYDVECARGHRACMVLQNPRYELLMDSAALALRDDYYREAVVSFAASLEAFWGFAALLTAPSHRSRPWHRVALR